MKRLTALCLATVLAGSAIHAAPLCDAFANPDAMPKKYQRLAPVLSGGPDDWIITRDQMDTDYVPSAEAQSVLAQIVQEFEARGTKLAILMAPPRPLVAGEATLNALAGDDAGFDTVSVSASFNDMIRVVQDAGAIAPNLLTLATRDDVLRQAYYYRHDTHWTPRGAAESAVALADAVVAENADGFAGKVVVRPDWNGSETFEERGSLADMARAVCDVEIASVETLIPSFPKADLGLFDDASDKPNIILAGSSFSNRYKKDAYRVADAIGSALQANVVNHSVSGGGAIGSIEGIVNAGLLDGDMSVDLVVWELPYTEGLRSVGPLRQLLGALQMKRGQVARQTVALDTSGKTLINFDDNTPEVLALALPNADLQRIKVDLRFEDGSKQTLGMVRKKHVPAFLRSDYWALSLTGLEERGLISATVRYDGKAIGAGAELQVF